MRLVRNIFLLLMLNVLLSACGEKKTSETADNDPVKGFRILMEQLRKSIDAEEPVISPPGGNVLAWYKREIFTSDKMQFDVIKTNSVVSPFLGKIDFECNTRFVKGISFDEVKDGEFTGTANTPCRATYVYQEGRWVFKNMSCLKLTASNPSDFWEIGSDDVTSVLGQCRSIADSLTSKEK